MDKSRRDQFIADWLEGSFEADGPSESECAEFLNELKSDSEFRRTASRGLLMRRFLEQKQIPSDGFKEEVLESLRAQSSATLTTAVITNLQETRRKQKRRLWGCVAVAMTAMLAFVMFSVFASSSRSNVSQSLVTSADVSPNTAIVTLLLEEGCIWSPRGPIGEGKRLEAGRFDLQSGTAILRFDSGAELVMIGPCAIELESAVSVLVDHGNVVVRATNGAEGFAVKTPTSEVVDLGTEFAIKAKHSGETEVHVLDGKVSCRKLGAAAEFAQIVEAGEGVALDKHGRQRVIPMSSPRFADVVSRINPMSRADLLTAYEGFDYSPGVLPLPQSTVGIGWDGPWRRRLPEELWAPLEDATPGELQIADGLMNVTWPVPGGRLGMLKLPSGNVYYVRPLQNAIDLGTDAVTYFSLMVRELERRTDQGQPREYLRLTFRSSHNYFGDSLSFGHGPRYRPRVQAGSGDLFTSPFELPAEQTTLWIGKVVARAQGEDEVYFRIYGEEDVLGYAEPATWHVVTRNVFSDAQLDRVLLSSTGKFGRIVDELRIGPTWRSVAPMSEQTK